MDVIGGKGDPYSDMEKFCANFPPLLEENHKFLVRLTNKQVILCKVIMVWQDSGHYKISSSAQLSLWKLWKRIRKSSSILFLLWLWFQSRCRLVLEWTIWKLDGMLMSEDLDLCFFDYFRCFVTMPLALWIISGNCNCQLKKGRKVKIVHGFSLAFGDTITCNNLIG